MKIPQLFRRFAFEFITILTAVLLSFTINEWRIKQENKALAIDLLEQMESNLQLDTASFHRNIGAIESWLESYEALLDIQEITSIDTSKFAMQMDHMISYTKFVPVNTGYEEMKQTGGSYLIRNKKLLKQIIQLYTFSYNFSEEWNKIDSQHILERVIPYIDSHFPYSAWADMSSLVEEQPEKLIAELRANHFKNLIRTNKMFKEVVKNIYGRNLMAADSALLEVQGEINHLKGN
ncbi:MAG: hypothetical protein AAF798_20085 [Bacteroidota bacterium]